MKELKSLSKDPVPNVRLNVAKTCQILLKSKHVNKDDIQPIISTLSQDSDRDVKFFSSHVA